MIELSKVYSPSEKIILCPDPQLFSWQECLQSEEGTLPSSPWNIMVLWGENKLRKITRLSVCERTSKGTGFQCKER